jgi:hypothetical protein
VTTVAEVIPSGDNGAQMLSADNPPQQRQLVPKPSVLLFKLLSIYLLFVIGRFAISLATSNPLIPTDEVLYKNFAYSFFRTGDFYRTANLGHSTYIPNILYPFLISPSFLLREQFYIGFKLINSLLINASFFPAYSLAREFISHRKALLTATAVLLLPSFHFVSFVAVDGLNIPLFLFCFLFCYRSLTGNGLHGLLAGLFMTLLSLNKPTACAYVAGFFFASAVLLFWLLATKDTARFRTVLYAIVLNAMSFAVSFIVLTLLLKHEVSYRLGGYTSTVAAQSPRVSWITTCDMAIAYIFALSSIGYVFLFASALAWLWLGRTKNERRYDYAVLLGLTYAITLAYWVMVSKFTLDVSNAEHFERLHTRYLFMVCPLFVICFSVFVEKLTWTKFNLGVLFISLIFVTWVNLAHFFPTHVIHGLAVFDSPETGWAVPPGKLLHTISYLSIAGVFVLYLFRQYRSSVPYLAFFVPFVLVSNYGEIRNHFSYDVDNSQNANYRYFVQGNITDINSSVAVVDEWLGHRLWLAFWLPYDYTAVYDLPKDSVITRQMIPERTRYLILFGDYQPEIPVRLVGRSGKCSIVAVEQLSKRN